MKLKFILTALPVIFTLISCQTLHIGETKNGYALFVAPNGNDQWSGTLSEPAPAGNNGPFKTIEKARDTIRLLNKNNEIDKPVTVYIREGVYELEAPLRFTPQDSGTADTPIRYIAYPQETPVISAGRELNFDTFKRDGQLIEIDLPQVRENGWVFRQLFVNGERQTRARTPNKGMYRIVGKFSLDEQANATYRDTDINPQWAKTGDVEFVSPVKWSQLRMPIVAVDTPSNTVTLANSIYSHMLVDDQRYWIENYKEAVDSPGEWYLDSKTGTLYYHLKEGEVVAGLEFTAPVHEHAVILQGEPENDQYVQHLNFTGLEFRYTAWPMPENGHQSDQAAHLIPAAFQANGAAFCKVSQCTLSQLGNYGIYLEQGCQNNRLVGNTISDVGAGGVRLGEKQNFEEDSLKTHHNFVTDNTIQQFGRVFPAAVGVWIGQSAHNRIAHNHIHDGYYTGISVGWTWGYRESNCHHNIVEKNLVHNIGQYFLSDMGGIYTLGIQPGTIIRNNIFHDIYSFDYGGWGLYTDEGSTGIVMEKNIVYNTKSAGFHQHYGKENIIRNNILAFGTEYQIMRTRNEDHLSFTFEKNIVYYDSGELLGSNFEGDNYHFEQNIYWDAREMPIKFKDWSWEEWRERGQDDGSKIARPMFYDPNNANFRLQPESPAFEIGFENIDTSDVGPRVSMTEIKYQQ